MQTYRKRPIVIEAVQLTWDNCEDVCEWIGGDNLADGTSTAEGCVEIVTLEGYHMGRRGDYIIKGIAGEFYPCKPDIFEATYEKCSLPNNSPA